jgi:CheY-like chemotaxis protein
LNGVVARTLRLRGYQLVSNKITVETDLATDISAVVGDARQLQQVCLNLVTNAIQAMSMLGGGTLYVSTRAEGDYVVLDMRDTGPGISEAAKAHIFEPFFTTKGEGEGTGLGLSVSYGIITAHGGKIEVVSTSPGGGTTFRVTLPAVADAVREVKARESGGVMQGSPLMGIRLLFIDDEPTLRAGVQAFGELRGFTVIVASNGFEGLDLIRDMPVDAVVCDLRMPGMDGAAFHDRLRREHPGLAARTVFITGDVMTNEGRGGDEGAANGQPILTKPFAFEKLEETLGAVMRSAPTAAATVGWS